MNYYVADEDDIWCVYLDNDLIGRALSKRDAEAFVEALRGTANLRQRILDNVSDAIEEAFDGAVS